MIKKIISVGQTGADRAGLDVAIKFNISHGGWIPKGRKTEDGTLPDMYRLQEMPTSSYPARAEKNVLDSDGTVIFSHGPLTGGSKLTQQLATKHDKPCLHIDLNEVPGYNAVFLLRRWMFENNVKILNVAGSRTSKDPEIYKKVFDIIKGIYWTDRLKAQDQDTVEPVNVRIVDDAVEQILAEFPLRDQIETANMNEKDLAILQAVLAKYIGEKMDDWSVSKDLYEDCKKNGVAS